VCFSQRFKVCISTSGYIFQGTTSDCMFQGTTSGCMFQGTTTSGCIMNTLLE